MARGRRADAVVFGFDFQVNAAIVLFLDNLKDVKSLRLEGNYEDIEIELDNGKYVLAQAKAVEKASSDFANVRANMKKAIESLSEGNQKVDAQELIMVTNSPDPFKDKDSKSVFYGHARRSYDSLPESAKKYVDKYLGAVPTPFEKEKFTVQVIPFETDDDRERYKVIMECINDFVGEINPNIPGLGRKLLDVWHWQVFDSGDKHNAEIKLSKKDIVWPILVKITEDFSCDDEFLEQFEPGLYEEISHRYAEIIETHCEKCESFIKILSEYNSFEASSPKEKLNEFIEAKWKDFSDYFSAEKMEDEVKEAITRIVMYRVIKRRIAIDRVKEGANL